MHTGRRFRIREVMYWTRRDFLKLVLWAAIPTILYVLGWDFLTFPWVPTAMLGTAVAFIVGFKNNASYNRLWEGRQIYGSIINDSRSFGFLIRDSLGGKNNADVKEIFNRHFAWLTALRYQLREPRNWENMEHIRNREYLRNYKIPERETTLDSSLKAYLGADTLEYVLSKKNRATQLMALQSKHTAELYDQKLINDFQWTQIQQSLAKFIDNQGRAERIKNFPYPRNFSSITTILLYLFVLLVPLGLLKEFAKMGDNTFMAGYTIWLNIPFAALLSWVFVTLDTVGESSVNPFEGSANDVPISQISRTIEIDMRDMLDESNLPPAIAPVNNIVL